MIVISLTSIEKHLREKFPSEHHYPTFSSVVFLHVCFESRINEEIPLIKHNDKLAFKMGRYDRQCIEVARSEYKRLLYRSTTFKR